MSINSASKSAMPIQRHRDTPSSSVRVATTTSVTRAVASLRGAFSDVLPSDSRKKLDGQLRRAARSGNAGQYEALIILGGNPAAPSHKKGYTALHEAVRSGNPALLRTVLAGPHIDADAVNQAAVQAPCLTPLHLAVMNDDVVAVRQLLDAGADPSAVTRPMKRGSGATPYNLAVDIANAKGRGGHQGLPALRNDPDTVIGRLVQAAAERGMPEGSRASPPSYDVLTVDAEGPPPYRP